MNIYLQLESGTGNLYEYSKKEQDGFVKHERTNKAGEKVISYRRYHTDGIFGNFLGAARRESEMGAQKVLNLSIVMEGANGDRYFIAFPLKNAKNQIQQYAVSFLRYLPFLEIGRSYRLFSYAIEDKTTGKKNYGISMKFARLADNAVDTKNLVPTLTSEKLAEDKVTVIPGDIPKTDWDLVMDVPTANTVKRDTYLYELLKKYEVIATGGSKQKTFDSTNPEEALVVSNTVSTPEPTPVAPTNQEIDSALSAAVVVDEDDEDLPF